MKLLEEGFGQPVDLIAKHALVGGKVPVRAALIFPFPYFVLVQGQQYAIDLIFNELRQRPYVCRDDRRVAPHGLHRTVAKSVAEGRQKQKMRSPDQVQDCGIGLAAVRRHVGEGIEKAPIFVQEAGARRTYPGPPTAWSPETISTLSGNPSWLAR